MNVKLNLLNSILYFKFELENLQLYVNLFTFIFKKIKRTTPQNDTSTKIFVQ